MHRVRPAIMKPWPMKANTPEGLSAELIGRCIGGDEAGLRHSHGDSIREFRSHVVEEQVAVRADWTQRRLEFRNVAVGAVHLEEEGFSQLLLRTHRPARRRCDKSAEDENISEIWSRNLRIGNRIQILRRLIESGRDLHHRCADNSSGAQNGVSGDPHLVHQSSSQECLEEVRLRLVSESPEVAGSIGVESTADSVAIVIIWIGVGSNLCIGDELEQTHAQPGGRVSLRHGHRQATHLGGLWNHRTPSIGSRDRVGRHDDARHVGRIPDRSLGTRRSHRSKVEVPVDRR